MHRYAVAKVNDHWCDQLDSILGVNCITRGDFLHWGSAKWEHTIHTVSYTHLTLPTILLV